MTQPSNISLNESEYDNQIIILFEMLNTSLTWD